MASDGPAWIRQAEHRLDPALRRALSELYRRPAVRAGLVGSFRSAFNERFRRLPVLIQLREDCAEEAPERLCQWLEDCGCRRPQRLDLVHGIAVEAPVATIRQLVQHPDVHRLALDRPVRALLDVAAPTVRVPEVWALGNRGSGITIAVLDTGIYPHPDFMHPRRRLLAFYDAVHGRSLPYDDNGHGTHVAGVAAGNGMRSDGRFTGIAPEADLVAVKVLDAQGGGRLSGVIAGLEWVCKHAARYRIRVLNLSLGAPAETSYRDDLSAQAVGRAWEQGLVVCAAAGNEGPHPGSISSPGVHPAIITVGACDDRRTSGRDDDVVAPFSSRGPTPDGVLKPDVVAPGVKIVAASAPDSPLARQQRAGSRPYLALSGTSMATPIVAGIAALLLKRAPAASPDQIKAWLVATATQLADADADAQGHGLVDASAAIVASAAPRRRTSGAPAAGSPDRRARV